MWSDALLAAERAHLVRLAIWGAISVLTGTGLAAWITFARRESGLIRHFSYQTAAWGAIDLGICLVAWRGLALRDLAGAVQLDRFLWLNIGLDAGYVMVGITLAIVGWRLGRRTALIGAGIGVVVQGVALLLLDLILSAQVVRVT